MWPYCNRILTLKWSGLQGLTLRSDFHEPGQTCRKEFSSTTDWTNQCSQTSDLDWWHSSVSPRIRSGLVEICLNGSLARHSSARANKKWARQIHLVPRLVYDQIPEKLITLPSAANLKMLACWAKIMLIILHIDTRFALLLWACWHQLLAWSTAVDYI